MNVLLIGTGYMGCEYAKVLKDLNVNLTVIGNSFEKCNLFEQKVNIQAIEGGIEAFAKNNDLSKYHIINAVNVEKLFKVTKFLLKKGAKRILVEKPAGLFLPEIEELVHLTKENGADLFVAYNRRFYTSVIWAKKMIKDDGGVLSFNFEFTEWSHVIEKLDKPDVVLKRWFLANSTHVVDLAFYLGGKPQNISVYTEGGLNWHPSASIFSGSGKSEKKALFSYFANWESAGRWGVEVLTRKNKYIFRPMEKLKVQKKGTIVEEEVNIDYSLDEKYKPGLFLQTKAFLEGNDENLCSIFEQKDIFPIYLKMANYE